MADKMIAKQSTVLGVLNLTKKESGSLNIISSKKASIKTTNGKLYDSMEMLPCCPDLEKILSVKNKIIKQNKQ